MKNGRLVVEVPKQGGYLRRTRYTFLVTYLFVALVLGFAALPANAQDNSSVTGVVTDPSGAVVADASVTLTNPAIGFSLTKTTNSIGVYEFTSVPPATNYSLVFLKSGFSTLTLDQITLNVGNKETRDARLSLGDTKVSIEVTASATETLNTTDATIGSNIDGDRIQDLPNVLVNNAANYLALAPGVTPGGAVTGTRSDQTNITLDGLDVNDQRGGFAFTTTVNTPLDSIQELKVTTAGADATYGHSSGGQLELVTKSGTNEFHGQAFEYNRTTDYTANDYFNNLNGIPNPQLIRNQFGGDLGGPILKKKIFFFFSYNGLRAVQPGQNLLLVPVPAVLNGQLNYVNTGGQTVTTPLSGPNSLAALDPQGIGADQSLLSFLQGRGYAGTAGIPAPNNNSIGDGINTSGFFFVSPVRQADNTVIGKVDYQISTNHRLSARATFDRSVDGQFPVQVFPSDPNPSQSFIDHSRSWVVGETWTVSPTMTNQASFGETNQVNAFAVNNKPTSPNSLSFFDGFFGQVISNPFLGLNEQFPVVPVYQGRDTFTWVRGKHILQFGGVISPVIFKSGNLTDTNTFGIGIGGFLTGLTPAQRPSDFGGNAINAGEWDRLFALSLGRYSSISSGYNYNLAGNPILPQGGVPIRDYHSTQYEGFAQDSWSVRSDFTLTYGVRYTFHKPLTEVNGFEAIQNQTPQSIFSVRQADAAQGISGPDAVPFVTYRPGGSANNAPGYYKPSYNNFGPRIGLAYSPSATDGWRGRLFGNRQTSIRAGFGLDYDNNLIGQGFELDETSFLFSNTPLENFGNIATDTRFSCPSPCTGANLSASLPAPVAPGTTPRPTFTPNLDSTGFPIGFFNGGFGQGAFFNFDPNYKTPYEMHFSLGVQRQLPGGWLVEADYVGKQGRRLPALGDPAQTLNFKDAASGQTLYKAFGAVQKEVQTGAPVTSQPWFENQMGAALAQYGFNCGTATNALLGVTTTCTQLAAAFGGGQFFSSGDVSSEIQTLADFHNLSGVVEQGLLLPNVGLLAQNGAAGFIGNYSASSYNALIIRVNHRVSHNLTMELNYTYSHSIDNDSGVQNNLIDFATAEICDLRNLRVCRGSSDFDHRHILVSNFEYGLPFGQGKWLAHNSSKLVDELIGGWHVSGIFTAYTGSPFKVDSGAFTIDFTQTQPAVFIGTRSDVKSGIHQVAQGAGVPNSVQFFSNPTNAQSAFTGPIAGGPGNRNILASPGLWDLDVALLKDFKMPWSESHKLQFRTDAINVFNHVNFSSPGASLLNPSTFGNITSDVNGPRVLQLGLRYMF
jgi:Carboxypeptidase regulatory-like domain